MELGLMGKVVLVTGGSKGIGLACAEAFLAEGAQVAIASRNPVNLAQAQERLAALGYAVQIVCADLTKPDQAVAMVEAVEAQLGPVDVLINSAGAARRHAVPDLNPAAWQSAMEAKYFTYIHTMDVVLKRMAARGRGTVVNIIGNGGKVAAIAHLAGGAANAGLMLATVGLAQAYAPQGVRVNGINPALTHTERLGAAMKLDAATKGITEAEALRAQESNIPLGRVCTPAEVANVAVFLASDKASYVTGAIIPMDGAANPVI